MTSRSVDRESGPRDQELSSAEIPEQELALRSGAAHETSVAVWDLTTPVVVGRRPTLKVGLSCSSGCNLSGTPVAVYNDAGERIGTGTLGSAPWPATAALYWTELDLVAPEHEGDLSLGVHATSAVPHSDATCVVTSVVSKPPEHHVRVLVIDKTSRAPLAGVELRVGAFRAATDVDGIAHVEVPDGTCEICTWNHGYEMVTKPVDIRADTTVHLELTESPKAEQAYWM